MKFLVHNGCSVCDHALGVFETYRFNRITPYKNGIYSHLGLPVMDELANLEMSSPKKRRLEEMKRDVIATGNEKDTHGDAAEQSLISETSPQPDFLLKLEQALPSMLLNEPQPPALAPAVDTQSGNTGPIYHGQESRDAESCPIVFSDTNKGSIHEEDKVDRSRTNGVVEQDRGFSTELPDDMRAVSPISAALAGKVADRGAEPPLTKPEEGQIFQCEKSSLDEDPDATNPIAYQSIAEDHVHNGVTHVDEQKNLDVPPNSTQAQQSEAMSSVVVTQGDIEKKEDADMERITESKSVAAADITIGSTYEKVAQANKFDADAEFEMDSSPLESSSSDTATDSSSSEHSDINDSDAEDYELLSPAEEARRLMAEDAGAAGKSSTHVPRTQNEQPEEIIEKPQVNVSTDMRIEELGVVENLVENLALIKATTSGEYQVLEPGSVLCLGDRSVIGVITETLGRVQQPYYSVRFTNMSSMEEAGVVKDIKIFYVDQLSTTVFTQPLKAYKGSDASNLHDEEVAYDELEFSDDEAEAEYRRQRKLQKRARHDAKHGEGDRFLQGSQQRHDGFMRDAVHPMPSLPEKPPNPSEPSLNYDDGENNSDELYTPLARPSNLLEMMKNKQPPLGNHDQRGGFAGPGRGRGRGDRGGNRSGHRGRGDRGRGFSRRGQYDTQRNPQSHAHPGLDRQYSGGPYYDNNGSTPANRLPPRRSSQTNGDHAHPHIPQYPMQRSYNPSHSPGSSHSHPSQPSQYNSQNPQSYQPYYQNQYSQHPYTQAMPSPGAYAQYPTSSSPPYISQRNAASPPITPAIPPGAHINPNFFRQQNQQAPQIWNQQHIQQPFPSQPYQQYEYPSPANGMTAPQFQMSPEDLSRLQQNLYKLNGLNKNL